MNVYEIVIATTPEKLWRALTDPSATQRYFFGSSVESSFAPGAPIAYTGPAGEHYVDGVILEADPPKKLAYTFQKRWDDGPLDPPSRVTWEIEPSGAACLLRLVHDQLVPGSTTEREVQGGWPTVVAGLKAFLETDEAAPTFI